MSRFQKIVIALLVGLIVVVIVGVAVIVNNQTQAERQATYLLCLEIRGYTPNNASIDDPEFNRAVEECLAK